MPSFLGGQNDFICQNFGKVGKKNFTKKSEKLFQGVYMDEFDKEKLGKGA